MSIPHRGVTSDATYFITASTFQKKALFQSHNSAQLFLDVLFSCARAGNYLLHEFVVMPDHFHLLMTPTAITIERSVQLIKGGFSFRVKRELAFGGEVWQSSFFDRRVRDSMEYDKFRLYIHRNPVERGLCEEPAMYPYSSAAGCFHVDDVPQRLKPLPFPPSEMQA